MFVAHRMHRCCLILLSILLLFMGMGCEEDDDNDLDGRYPPPDSGNTAVITIDHRQLEPNRVALSYGGVQVLIDGARTLDAQVTMGNVALYYDTRERAFYDQLIPPLVPGTSYKVRVRSFTWGEDTTFVYLPGDFDLQPSLLQVAWQPGMEYPFSWSESERAHRYVVRISILDAVEALLQDTLGTDETSYLWEIPEEAGAQQIKVRVTAERNVNDPPVWSGTSRTYSDFELHVNP